MKLNFVDKGMAEVSLNWSDLTLLIRAVASQRDASSNQLQGLHATIFKQLWDARVELEQDEIDLEEYNETGN